MPLPPVVATATPAPATREAAQPVSAAAGGERGWGWWPWLAGTVVLLAAAAIALVRRRRASDDMAAEHAYADLGLPPAPPAAQPAPPARLGVATSPAAAPAGQAQPEGEPLIEFVPLSLATRGPDAVVAFELVVVNPGAAALDGVRATVAITTAGPDIADRVAAFGAAPSAESAVEPFDLAPGASRRIGGELRLPGDAMYVTEHGDRAMIVPVALVALRWRSGLSLRARLWTQLIGTGDRASAKLGPVWVDRPGQRYTRLAARPFTLPTTPR